MNCLSCKSKACKTRQVDCTGVKEDTIASYKNLKTNNIYNDADKLISNGRAGTLSRLEEIAEFAVLQGYKKIGIAYCYGIEEMAVNTKNYLISRGLSIESFRCTIQGIQEKQINCDLGGSVSCNPIGQAEAINSSEVDFVIEMGLCLGHDVIFHEKLQKPFTVFVVKDRVYSHSPHKFLEDLEKEENNKKAV